MSFNEELEDELENQAHSDFMFLCSIRFDETVGRLKDSGSNFGETTDLNSVGVPLGGNSTIEVQLAQGSDPGEKPLGVRALVDSGALGCFISKDIVSVGKFPFKRKQKPITVVLASKESSLVLEHATEPLKLSIGDHSEMICFDIMPNLSHPIILGTPWLRRHNPRIEWPVNSSNPGEISFSCLCSANEDNSGGVFTCASVIRFGEILDDHEIFESEDEFHLDCDLPVQYIDLKDVFSPIKADILPEQRPYDCEIILRDPKHVLPFCPIIPLPVCDHESMRDFIEDGLRTGKIQRSKSPAGAAVFFVPKKDKTKRLCVDYRPLSS